MLRNFKKRGGTRANIDLSHRTMPNSRRSGSRRLVGRGETETQRARRPDPVPFANITCQIGSTAFRQVSSCVPRASASRLPADLQRTPPRVRRSIRRILPCRDKELLHHFDRRKESQLSQSGAAKLERRSPGRVFPQDFPQGGQLRPGIGAAGSTLRFFNSRQQKDRGLPGYRLHRPGFPAQASRTDQGKVFKWR